MTDLSWRGRLYEKIVTHSDFDGIVSAAICASVLKVDHVVFAGPLTIARSQLSITEKDVVCDLPYPLVCGLWFDHHEGNLHELAYRKIDPKSIPGRFDLKASCSRVVHEYFSESIELSPHFAGIVAEADRIDGFSYASMEEWREETAGKVIDLTLKSRFSSSQEQTTYMRNLFHLLKDRPLEEISRLPWVVKRLEQYREEEARMLRMIRESSYFLDEDPGRELVVVDLTPHARRPHLIKNLAFVIYPEALAVVEVYNLTSQGVKSNDLGFSMSLSIEANKRAPAKNIGEIMRSLNIGDGHPGAAAGIVRCRSKAEMLRKKKEILSQLFRIWSTQHGEK